MEMLLQICYGLNNPSWRKAQAATFYLSSPSDFLYSHATWHNTWNFRLFKKHTEQHRHPGQFISVVT